jgi:putative hydrolase of the HAD superfamily
MAIRAIVFDFGNVVGFFSHRRAAQQLAAYAAEGDAGAIQDFVFGRKLDDDFERGAIDSAAFRARVREGCRLACDDAQFDAAYSDIFWPNPEVTELLPRLCGRYRLLLLSNTTELHSRWFRRQFAAVLAHLDHVVLSHEVGLRKPDRRVFEHCRVVAGCTTSECLFVDDTAVNVEAARAYGWHALVYRPGGNLRGQLAELGVREES